MERDAGRDQSEYQLDGLRKKVTDVVMLVTTIVEDLLHSDWEVKDYFLIYQLYYVTLTILLRVFSYILYS